MLRWIGHEAEMQFCVCRHTLWLGCLGFGGLAILQRSGVQPSERLAPLGILGAQLSNPMNPLEHHGTMVPRWLREETWDA